MPKCIILVGVPASGKTTWLSNNRVAWSKTISTDNIIEEIASQYHFTYDEAFKDLISFAEKVMWKDLKANAKIGNTIYIDRTNMSAKGRKKFIDFLKPYGYTFEAVDFEIPEKDELERRLNSRVGKFIPKNILKSMADNYEMPLKSEGFEKITFIKNSG